MKVNEEFPFKLQSEIEQYYKARGFFYDLIVPWQSELIPCRNVLELYEATLNVEELKNRTPDAHVVMMNPGSSQPLETRPELILLDEIGQKLINPIFVSAKPDNTQYQVMRLMEVMGWRFVRILNLSDIREPKSLVFHDKYKRYEQMHRHFAHSIFSEERKRERDHYLPLEIRTPLILGWGVGETIMPLANRYAKTITKGRNIVGWHKAGNLYYHPLPQQHSKVVLWFQKLANELTK